MSYYQTLIAELAGPGYDPRHLEAYIRIEHPTLGHLTRERFRHEVAIAKACVDAAGRDEAERAARSFGL